MGLPILRVESLSKHFGGLAALKEVSFQVSEGQIFGFIGPNGAGKTTLFSIIAGALRPSAGRVLARGKDLTGRPPFELVREGIARTHQVVVPFRSMTVLENVQVGVQFGRRKVRGSAAARRVAEEILSWVAMEAMAGSLAGVLSLGSQKRLELARALASEPELLLCDEICGGLTQTETGAMLELLRRIRGKGTTLLYIEHDVKAIMSVCDRVVALNYGEKLAEGSPAEIQNNPAVIEAYLGSSGSSGQAEGSG